MKRLITKFWLWFCSVFMTAFIAIRLVLEVVGYATLPDDAKEAHGLLKVVAEMALALPWWAIWWPLFLSLVASCLMALDFSFDVFKRKPKAKPKTKAHRLKIISHNFSTQYSDVNSKHYNFFSPEDKVSAISEVEIFINRLSDFGINHPPKGDSTASDIIRLKLLISRYMPYLRDNDYDKAVEISKNLFP